MNSAEQIHQRVLRMMRNNGLTWVCLLQMFFQQAAVQEELEPRRLQRRAGPTAGHSSDPVCCLRTHPPLAEDDKHEQNTQRLNRFDGDQQLR